MSILSGLFVFLFSFQVGLVPSGNINYAINPVEAYYFENMFYAEFNVEVDIAKFIFIRGKLNNSFHLYDFTNEKVDFVQFSPDHDEYVFSVGLFYKWFEIGYRHKCYHPIFPYRNSFPEHEQEYTTLLEGMHNDIYVKFQGRLEM